MAGDEPAAAPKGRGHHVHPSARADRGCVAQVRRARRWRRHRQAGGEEPPVRRLRDMSPSGDAHDRETGYGDGRNPLPDHLRDRRRVHPGGGLVPPQGRRRRPLIFPFRGGKHGASIERRTAPPAISISQKKS